jgi:hypothetical protein
MRLSELRRLSDDVRAVVDSERGAEGAQPSQAHREFARACDDAGIPIKILDRRATENYFTAAAIQSATGVPHAPLAHFERLTDRANPWGKADNYKIARAMPWAELANTDLGEFIDAF